LSQRLLEPFKSGRDGCHLVNWFSTCYQLGVGNWVMEDYRVVI
jgi:hypothetical protein